MPETILQAASPAPLTTLTEDEILFRDNIRQFADEKIRPLVKEMDEKGVFDRELIHDFFQLGLMGIEIPEQYGGGAAKFFERFLPGRDCRAWMPLPALSSTCRTHWSTMPCCAGAPKSRRSASCPRWPLRPWAPMPSAKRDQVRTPLRCKPALSSKAATTFSTAASCGSRTPKRQDCSCCSPRSIPPPDTKASRHSWSRKTSLDSP